MEIENENEQKQNIDTNQNQQDKQKQIQQDQQANKDNKKARIFIKNLVFDINQKMIKKQFSKYGIIQEINIPLNPSTNKSQGFAFVQYQNVNMARKAIKEMNSQIYKGRKLQVQFAVDQRIYKKEPQKQQSQDSQNLQEINTKDMQQTGNNSKLNENKELSQDEEKKQEDKKLMKRNQTNYQNEDKQNIIFVKNIDYECDEQELKNNFQKAGKVISAKLVKINGTEKHKGSGFIKFKEKQTAQNIIKSYNLIQQNPEQKSILDPLNILTMNNRNLEILQCMDKQSLTNQLDTKQKKQQELNQKLSQGLPVLESNIELQNGSKQAIQNRRRHYEQKLIKQQNKNYKLSETKILLKNINKDLNKKFFMDLSQQILKLFYEEKNLRKMKIFKDINLMNKNNKKQNQGIVILNFQNKTFAQQFMQKINEKQFWSQLQKNDHEIPIVEFVFEDMQKLKRRNEIIEKIQQKQNSKNDVINQLAKRNKKIAKKSQYKNLKTEVKDLYNNCIQSKNIQDVKNCLEKLQQLKSRGIKKRMRKNLMQQFPELNIKD